MKTTCPGQDELTIVARSTYTPNLVVRDQESLFPSHKDETALSEGLLSDSQPW